MMNDKIRIRNLKLMILDNDIDNIENIDIETNDIH